MSVLLGWVAGIPILQLQIQSTVADSPALEAVSIQVPDGLAELADEYLQARRRQLGELQQMLVSDNVEQLRAVGHNLAGSGASFGLPHVSELGRSLEAAARAGDHAAAERELAALQDYVTRATLAG